MSKILKRVREERKGRYDHLHGFYPGETTEISYNTADKLEFIHAIALGTDAFAVDKQLHELTAMIDKVKIKSVRRAGQEFTAEDFQERLIPGDILVIAGKPRRIERAERYLLDGY
ncbi:MAG: hypothetical protein GY897_18320 [Alteromonas sp.]|jgi:CPA2 family monovalent cation:H+ antiporter-2|nr:hypothetical protein [Alteromonas sp.]